MAAMLPSHIEGELLYLDSFSLLSPPSNFVIKRVLPFSSGLKLHTQLGLSLGKHTAMIVYTDHTKSGFNV